MLVENKPTDYGIERQIWTGKNIVEVIKQRWDVDLRDSRIYAILKELGLSHQKAPKAIMRMQTHWCSKNLCHL
jgi:transposase